MKLVIKPLSHIKKCHLVSQIFFSVMSYSILNFGYERDYSIHGGQMRIVGFGSGIRKTDLSGTSLSQSINLPSRDDLIGIVVC